MEDDIVRVIKLSQETKAVEDKNNANTKTAMESSHGTKAQHDQHLSDLKLAIAESKKLAEEKKRIKIEPLVFQAPDTEGVPAMLFSDGSCSTITSMTPGIPKSIVEINMYGGLCFIIALFMENMEYFASRNIASPHALRQLLTCVDFKKNTMLEGDDIKKIADFLKVRICVDLINTKTFVLDQQVFGDLYHALNPVSLDMMNFDGGGHYVVKMPPGVPRVVAMPFASRS